MSKFFSRDRKKSENEKRIASKSLTTDEGHMIHSSSLTSFTVQHQITQRTETLTTTSIHQIGRSSPFASQTSLNSYTEKVNNPSGTNSSIQKYVNKDFNLKPQYVSNVSTDAIPFTRNNNYKSTPPRSAFTAAPLTSSTPTTAINLNYKSPYGDSRNRSRSIAIPNVNVNNTKTSWLSSLPNEIPIKSSSSPQNNNEDFKQKIVVNVKKSSKFYDDPQSKVPTYTTRSKNRGRLLLINNIKFVSEKQIRKGAELDEENIMQLFTQMGFNIVRSQNLNKKEMENKIISFRNNSSLKKVDIGAVIIMSHGTGKESSGSTEVVCTDGHLLQTTWIISQFDGTLCPYLLGKPKIFIFQCCRGDNKEVQIQHDSIPSSVPRKLSDMLIAYSTVPGFVSHRDPQTGTWYIQAICKVFMEHAHDTDVESLLKIVDDKLSNLVSNMGSKQTSSFENRGFKTCYLHPKLP